MSAVVVFPTRFTETFGLKPLAKATHWVYKTNDLHVAYVLQVASEIRLNRTGRAAQECVAAFRQVVRQQADHPGGA
jgi:hypothetical protein